MKTVPPTHELLPGARERRRRHAYEAARRDYPNIDLGFDQYCQHLDRLGHGDDLPAYSSAIYLCAACVEHAATACETLEATFFPTLTQAVSRIAPDATEDALQELRRRLLVESPPRIGTYRGQGPLAGWLHVAAINMARDQQRAKRAQRRQRRQIEAWSQAAGLGADPVGPEQEMFERHCARTLDRAMRAGIQALGPDARRLLHLHLVQGLSIDVLAKLYTIHRATVARRVRRHLDWLGAHILELIATEVGELSERELGHVARLWHRYSEFTMSRIFLSSTSLDDEGDGGSVDEAADSDGMPRVEARVAAPGREPFTSHGGNAPRTDSPLNP